MTLATTRCGYEEVAQALLSRWSMNWFGARINEIRMSLSCLVTNIEDERLCALLAQVAADLQLSLVRRTSIEDILQFINAAPAPPIVFLDLDERSKPEALAAVQMLARSATVIGIATQPCVRLVVEAIKRGAIDFLCKPLELKRCAEVLRATQDAEDSRNSQLNHARTRTAMLSTREREVLELLIEGCSVKEIALSLSISAKTAAVHRSRVFQKMKVDNVVELWRLLFGNPAKHLDRNHPRDSRLS